MATQTGNNFDAEVILEIPPTTCSARAGWGTPKWERYHCLLMYRIVERRSISRIRRSHVRPKVGVFIDEDLAAYLRSSKSRAICCPRLETDHAKATDSSCVAFPVDAGAID